MTASEIWRRLWLIISMPNGGGLRRQLRGLALPTTRPRDTAATASVDKEGI